MLLKTQCDEWKAQNRCLLHKAHDPILCKFVRFKLIKMIVYFALNFSFYRICLGFHTFICSADFLLIAFAAFRLMFGSKHYWFLWCICLTSHLVYLSGCLCLFSKMFIKFYFIIKHKREVFENMYTALPLPKLGTFVKIHRFGTILIDCIYICYTTSVILGK